MMAGHQPDHSTFPNLVWVQNPWNKYWISGLCNLGKRMTGGDNHWNVNTSFWNKDSLDNLRWHWSDGGDSSNTDGTISYMDSSTIRISAPTIPNHYVRTLVAHSSSAFRITSMRFFDLDG
jgi:hypothetical protein